MKSLEVLDIFLERYPLQDSSGYDIPVDEEDLLIIKKKLKAFEITKSKPHSPIEFVVISENYEEFLCHFSENYRNKHPDCIFTKEEFDSLKEVLL